MTMGIVVEKSEGEYGLGGSTFRILIFIHFKQLAPIIISIIIMQFPLV